ncbi:MAG: hypothetical protein WA966_13365 [Ornithinimicrobium sp.]
MKSRIRRWWVAKLQEWVPVGHISDKVTVGEDLKLPHGGVGVFVVQHATIGDRVTIYQGGVIGRYDAQLRDYADSPFDHVVVEDDVIIYANAVVVAGPGVTTLGRGSIVGAGAVLLGSTGPGEIWAGNPARHVGYRPGWEPRT